MRRYILRHISWQWSEDQPRRSFEWFFDDIRGFNRALKRVAKGHAPYIILEARLQESVYEPLAFLPLLVTDTGLGANPSAAVGQAEEERFNEEFSLGPRGLHGVVEWLQMIVAAVHDISVSSALLDRLHIHVESICEASILLVSHLQSVHPRSDWYPVGSLREFARAYEEASPFLQVCGCACVVNRS